MSDWYAARRFLVVEPGDNAAHVQPEKLVHGTHPARVPARQVVVDRDDVHAPRQCVEIGGKCCDQGLALARLHLGDAALMEDDAADQLDVEMPLAESPPRRLTDGREGFRQQVVERFAAGQTVAVRDGPFTESLVRARLGVTLERIDLLDGLAIFPEGALVRCPEDALGNST